MMHGRKNIKLRLTIFLYEESSKRTSKIRSHTVLNELHHDRSWGLWYF